MRLLELGSERPKVAGKAILEYSDKPSEGPARLPLRRRTHIVLPDRNNLELIQLQEKWNQFLIIEADLQKVWFGGTDENPFLVELNWKCQDIFFRCGPEGFYEALKPILIRRLAQQFGGEYVRQGDIFAWPLPYTWKEIKKAHLIMEGQELVTSPGKYSLFGTRHHLTGTSIDSRISLLGFSLPLVAEGVVAAPDHSPKTLEGPHVFAQTEGLHRPEAAD